MTESETPVVSLVLDTSAIAAWVRGSAAVGELLAEIDAEGGKVVIPLTCLLAAASQITTDREWLYLLLDHPTTVLISDDPEDWEMLSSTISLLGTADLASAAWIALDWNTEVLTQHSDRYAKLAGGNLALQIHDYFDG
ncbi:hypothetical protein ACWT_5751 [Actinoplanes sp. SE50]|uniref:hypothetical protein n=1 Tax=unclassified Actinoplanes TaxID=2626549 RepID=UPI00023ED66C|nr:MULTISPECIES: hypothetical protein [unclassified Actinoplanes]ATO85166.1 hypothetical protein ACWT_5751 [Actinoplanes sp. SE50]SLM02576.1 hypothetical protein ACSP50_5858 [Actinoplanes sp. SE50/110]